MASSRIAGSARALAQPRHLLAVEFRKVRVQRGPATAAGSASAASSSRLLRLERLDLRQQPRRAQALGNGVERPSSFAVERRQLLCCRARCGLGLVAAGVDLARVGRDEAP